MSTGDAERDRLIQEAEDAAECAETAIRTAWVRGSIRAVDNDEWIVDNQTLKHMLACAILAWQYRKEVMI